ncbi:hypothetical protein ACPA9J_14845 [Pseudomonas aeruginosa]
MTLSLDLLLSYVHGPGHPGLLIGAERGWQERDHEDARQIAGIAHLQPDRPARRLRRPRSRAGRTGRRSLGSLAAGPRGAGRGRLRERCQAWRRPGA